MLISGATSAAREASFSSPFCLRPISTRTSLTALAYLHDKIESRNHWVWVAASSRDQLLSRPTASQQLSRLGGNELSSSAVRLDSSLLLHGVMRSRTAFGFCDSCVAGYMPLGTRIRSRLRPCMYLGPMETGIGHREWCTQQVEGLASAQEANFDLFVRLI